MKNNFEVGTRLFVEQGGNGWARIEGYHVEVISKEDARECEFVEGLGLEEGELFVEVLDCIYVNEGERGEYIDIDELEDDELEIDYEEGSVWGVSYDGKFKVIN